MTPDLTGDRRRLRRETLIRSLFRSAALVTILISIAIILSLVFEAIAFIRGIAADNPEGLASLFAEGWFPRRGRFDLRTIVWHTILVALIAMVVATPLGLGAAIYLSEYARPRIRRFLKPALEILAGVPSVVIGFFALRFITPELLGPVLPGIEQSNLLAAGLGVGILIVPLVASVTEDAFRAVPLSLREASYGLGAKKRHTSLRVVFPAAISGVAAGLILGVSRAIGETMVVAIAAGATGGSLLTVDPTEGGQTMTGAMASLAIGSDRVAGASNAFQSLFFVGLLLFVMTFTLNVVSDRVVRRFRQAY